MKECCYSSCCILSFMKGFLKVKGSFSQLVGVRRVCVRTYMCTYNEVHGNKFIICMYLFCYVYACIKWCTISCVMQKQPRYS